VPSDSSNIDRCRIFIEIRSRLRTNPPHFSQPGSEASFYLQDITLILKIHCELVMKSRAKYATVPGQSVYERSTRLTFAVFRLLRDGSNIVAVRLSVISHFARRSVHSKAITPYSAARVCAQRRRKCYKYTKTFDTYTSCRLITQ